MRAMWKLPCWGLRWIRASAWAALSRVLTFAVSSRICGHEYRSPMCRITKPPCVQGICSEEKVWRRTWGQAGARAWSLGQPPEGLLSHLGQLCNPWRMPGLWPVLLAWKNLVLCSNSSFLLPPTNPLESRKRSWQDSSQESKRQPRWALPESIVRGRGSVESHSRGSAARVSFSVACSLQTPSSLLSVSECRLGDSSCAVGKPRTFQFSDGASRWCACQVLQKLCLCRFHHEGFGYRYHETLRGWSALVCRSQKENASRMVVNVIFEERCGRKLPPLLPHCCPFLF